jgi:hypothetical protein
MSTFGKKYLNYWPYRFDGIIIEDSILRWNRTNKDFQLELLKKWYPIGMLGKKIYFTSFYGWSKTTPNSRSYILEITGYIEYIYGWKLDVQYVDQNYKKDVHPIKFIPEKDDRLRILRELRLSKLLE